jgi:hypothetical protein
VLSGVVDLGAATRHVRFAQRQLKPRSVLIGLEQALRVVLTARVAEAIGGPIDNKNHLEGKAMTDHSESDNRDSVVDARAIFVLILLVVATAVYWVSQQ